MLPALPRDESERPSVPVGELREQDPSGSALRQDADRKDGPTPPRHHSDDGLRDIEDALGSSLVHLTDGDRQFNRWHRRGHWSSFFRSDRQLASVPGIQDGHNASVVIDREQQQKAVDVELADLDGEERVLVCSGATPGLSLERVNGLEHPGKPPARVDGLASFLGDVAGLVADLPEGLIGKVDAEDH